MRPFWSILLLRGRRNKKVLQENGEDDDGEVIRVFYIHEAFFLII